MTIMTEPNEVTKRVVSSVSINVVYGEYPLVFSTTHNAGLWNVVPREYASIRVAAVNPVRMLRSNKLSVPPLSLA